MYRINQSGISQRQLFAPAWLRVHTSRGELVAPWRTTAALVFSGGSPVAVHRIRTCFIIELDRFNHSLMRSRIS
jgi:hypothetical protein